jgi:hypothetical protein
MTVEITCPICGFSKTLIQENIPERVRFVNCPRCGIRFEFIKRDDTDLGLSTGITKTPGSEKTENENMLKGIYHSVKSLLFSPKNFFSRMKFGIGIGESFLFGLLIGSIGTMLGWFWQFLIFSGNKAYPGSDLSDLILSNISFYIVLILCPFFVTIKMFFIGGILHVSLLILRQVKSGFEGTFRVVAYSQASQIFSIIPFIGGIIGFIWQLIILLIGLKGVHRSSAPGVIAALLLPFGFMAFAIIAILLSSSLSFFI